MANSSIYAGFERLWQHVVTLVSGKVDKAEGKDLSTNDFTDEDKQKLDSIESMYWNTF